MGLNNWIGAVINVFKRVIPTHAILDSNSPYHRLNDAAGIHREKSVTLDGDGASFENLFTVAGTCLITHLFGSCTEAADTDVLTNVKWELDDGGAQDAISGIVNASGAVVGAQLQKIANAAGLTEFVNPINAVVTDAGAKILFEEFEVSQKTGGVTTYIRVAYTGDATADSDWTFELHFIPFGHNAGIEPV